MTYFLQKSAWMDHRSIPEGMNLDMLGTNSNPFGSYRLNKLLKPVIEKTVQNKIVIDMGAGTGVLGFYALEHGAKFIYFVEQDGQMCYILENVLSKKLDSTKYKLISKDIQNLDLSDFDQGIPDIAVSEFYGPTLFDEGYSAYTKHIRSMFPKCYFIPEAFVTDFYLNDIDYSYDIWPVDTNLIDHFKFMYKEKGFSKHIPTTLDKIIGTISFNANEQIFNNQFEFKYEYQTDKLLIGYAYIKHGDIIQDFTRFGWLMDKTEFGKKFLISCNEDKWCLTSKTEI